MELQRFEISDSKLEVRRETLRNGERHGVLDSDSDTSTTIGNFRPSLKVIPFKLMRRMTLLFLSITRQVSGVNVSIRTRTMY